MKLSDYCVPIDNAGLGNATRSAAFALLLSAALPLAAQTAAPGKTIQTFLVYYGGGPRLVAGDAQKMAKFDLIDTNKHRYDVVTHSDLWFGKIQRLARAFHGESQRQQPRPLPARLRGQPHLQPRLFRRRQQSILLPYGLWRPRLAVILAGGGQS